MKAASGELKDFSAHGNAEVDAWIQEPELVPV